MRAQSGVFGQVVPILPIEKSFILLPLQRKRNAPWAILSPSHSEILQTMLRREQTNMKVHIEDGCIGCGLCEATCPEVFRLEGGLAVVHGDPDANPAAVREAADGCPVSVIIIEE